MGAAGASAHAQRHTGDVGWPMNVIGLHFSRAVRWRE
jgi:hypothetical protein